MGARGCVALYGDTPAAHRMISLHCTSEKRVKIFNVATGRTVNQWNPPAPGEDNDLWDAVVGTAVAASSLGIDLKEVAIVARPRGVARTRVNMPSQGGRSFFVTDR